MATEPSTQQLVEVSEVNGELLVLKNGSLRTIIEVSAINFELRSEEEQLALLQNFQRFLNSVDFPIQIVIQSRKMEIDSYLTYIQQSSGQLDELLKIQAAEYGRFVKELSTLANIMSKKFFLVIPFYIYENPQKAGISQSIKSIFRPSKTTQGLSSEQLETYRNQMLQRAELVFDGLVSLGLKARPIEGDEAIQVLYSSYNPGGVLTHIPEH